MTVRDLLYRVRHATARLRGSLMKAMKLENSFRTYGLHHWDDAFIIAPGVCAKHGSLDKAFDCAQDTQSQDTCDDSLKS